MSEAICSPSKPARRLRGFDSRLFHVTERKRKWQIKGTNVARIRAAYFPCHLGVAPTRFGVLRNTRVTWLPSRSQ